MIMCEGVSEQRNLISITDLGAGTIIRLLDRSDALKARRASGWSGAQAGSTHTAGILAGRSVAMIFEKPSTRTRVSLEVATGELGGRALYLSAGELQLGRGETISDTAMVLSRFVHGITARVFNHRTVEALAEHASVPVINALSDQEHPLQILADLMTMRERFGRLKGLKVTWIGDGNNVCNSMILAAAILGMKMTVASPDGYGPKQTILDRAQRIGGSPTVLSSPNDAAQDADVLVTDTWVSMGDEAQEAERLRVFSRYQINANLIRQASDSAIVMHCLPAHRGQEITDEAMDGPHSAVFDEAENRLHTSKAVIEWLVGGRIL